MQVFFTFLLVVHSSQRFGRCVRRPKYAYIVALTFTALGFALLDAPDAVPRIRSARPGQGGRCSGSQTVALAGTVSRRRSRCRAPSSSPVPVQLAVRVADGARCRRDRDSCSYAFRFERELRGLAPCASATADFGFGGTTTSACSAPRALVAEGGVWVIDPVAWSDAEERARALGEPRGVLQLLDRHDRDTC